MAAQGAGGREAGGSGGGPYGVPGRGPNQRIFAGEPAEEVIGDGVVVVVVVVGWGIY